VNVEVEEHLRTADRFLRVARDLVELGHAEDTVSRAYYAMFHAATAVLLELGIERSSHHAVWAAFGQFVTAPGLMDRRYHRLGLDLLEARNESDYWPAVDVPPEAAAEAFDSARDFVAACRQFLEGR